MMMIWKGVLVCVILALSVSVWAQEDFDKEVIGREEDLVEEDPLMAPINVFDESTNNQDGQQSNEQELSGFAALPGMQDLIKDSEQVMQEEQSFVKAAIRSEREALEDAGKFDGFYDRVGGSDEDSGLNAENSGVDIDNVDRGSKDSSDSVSSKPLIFNTDDFDDDWDDIVVDGNRTRVLPLA
jgi:hypothetical protein